jgi:starch synthase
MVSSEALPFARTGGLGDVVTGLSLALGAMGCEVAIVTPRYGVSRVPDEAAWWVDPVRVRIGWGEEDVAVLGVLETSLPAAAGSVRVLLLDHPNLFARAGIYGDEHGAFGDNDIRFTAMSRGALAVAQRLWPDAANGDGGPDILHAHDWHAAMAILSAKLGAGTARSWASTRCVFTIHNLAFQGVYYPETVDRLALPRAALDDGTLLHEGHLNLLSGAVVLADRVTTVSPTYAREIKGPRFGCRLDPVLVRHARKLSGIVNGIDEDRFDPARDAALAARYGSADAREGKGRCRAALALALGLSDQGGDGPLFASVSRLTGQKGIDLLLAVVPALVERGARFALVGEGDPPLEQALRAIADRFPGRVATRIAFDDSLARQVYAGADFFAVPSRYEPCGLTQLYAMRYGAIPVVTAVGGLADTVTPIDALKDVGTGFVAPFPDTASLLVACEDALCLYGDRPAHDAAVSRAMARDSSWREPARAYTELYASALGEATSRPKLLR